MLELTVLKQKLDTLLKSYASLRAENQRLQDKVNDQAQQIGMLNNKLADLEENVMAVKMDSSAVLNDQDKEVMKKQLDTVIGEIDKILATLND